MKLTRRSLTKALAMTGVAGSLPSKNAFAEQTTKFTPSLKSWQEIHPGIWRARFGKPEVYTPVSTRLVQPKSTSFRSLPAVPQAPLKVLAGTVTQRGCVIELPLRPKEQVYGLGLQLLAFNQRGKKKVARVNADPRMDTGDSHAPVPFYVTTEGIGVLIDTARYATFYFGDARPKPREAAKSVSDGNSDPNYTPNLQDADEGRVMVEIPHAAGVDIYLFAGPTMLDAVRRYNIFSGGGHVPPDWGLGFWYRPESRATQESTLALATEFRDRKIPCDVLGLEAGWQTHAYPCTFVWEKKRFPDPSAFIQKAGAMGYRVNLWEHAFTHPASPLFEPLQSLSGDHGVWGGLVPDFADERARRTFGTFHGETLIDRGISGFKLDECDNSDYTGGWSFPELSRFPSGIDGEQMHGVFGLRYQAAIWEEFKKRKQDTYCLVRSSGALAAPYPFVLYSDLYGHRDFIRALANSGFSGLSWCPEVRDAVNEDDLIRRLQSVVFSPLAMVNGWYIKSPPWRQLNRKLNNAGQQMDGWEQVEERCREIIGWRMSLLPYLKSAFERYAEDGTPPFRALVLDNPQDDTLLNVDDQYMIGDRMMVAPLFAGESARNVVIPTGGDWCDFWTGDSIKAGSTVTVDASEKNIPVYIKKGSIVPWAQVGSDSGAPESRKLTVRVYGDGSLPFSLGVGTRALKLTWGDGKGTILNGGDYMVESWKPFG